MSSHDIVKEVLQNVWAEFIEHFDAAATVDPLFSKELIDQPTMQVILEAKSSKDANRAFLLHLISNATVESLLKLCGLLRDTARDRQRHDSLAKLLEDKLRQWMLPVPVAASPVDVQRSVNAHGTTISELTDTVLSDEDAASRLGIVAALDLSERESQRTYTDEWLAKDPPQRKLYDAFFRLQSCLAKLFDKHIDCLKPFFRTCQKNGDWPYKQLEVEDIDAANDVQTIFNKIRIENCWLNTEVLIRLINVLPDQKSRDEQKAKQHLEVYHRLLGVFSKFVLLSHIPIDDARLEHFRSCLFPKQRVTYDVNIEDFDVSKLFEQQKFLSTIFKIPKEAFHYLEARPTESTLVTWSLAISIEKAHEVFQRATHEFWSLKENSIIKVEIEGIFQLHLRGRNLLPLIKTALQRNQDLLACTEHLSHQFMALVDYSHSKRKGTEPPLQLPSPKPHLQPSHPCGSVVESEIQEPAWPGSGLKMAEARFTLDGDGSCSVYEFADYYKDHFPQVCRVDKADNLPVSSRTKKPQTGDFLVARTIKHTQVMRAKMPEKADKNITIPRNSKLKFALLPKEGLEIRPARNSWEHSYLVVRDMTKLDPLPMATKILEDCTDQSKKKVKCGTILFNLSIYTTRVIRKKGIMGVSSVGIKHKFLEGDRALFSTKLLDTECLLSEIFDIFVGPVRARVVCDGGTDSFCHRGDLVVFEEKSSESFLVASTVDIDNTAKRSEVVSFPIGHSGIELSAVHIVGYQPDALAEQKVKLEKDSSSSILFDTTQSHTYVDSPINDSENERDESDVDIDFYFGSKHKISDGSLDSRLSQSAMDSIYEGSESVQYEIVEQRNFPAADLRKSIEALAKQYANVDSKDRENLRYYRHPTAPRRVSSSVRNALMPERCVSDECIGISVSISRRISEAKSTCRISTGVNTPELPAGATNLGQRNDQGPYANLSNNVKAMSDESDYEEIVSGESPPKMKQTVVRDNKDPPRSRAHTQISSQPVDYTHYIRSPPPIAIPTVSTKDKSVKGTIQNKADQQKSLGYSTVNQPGIPGDSLKSSKLFSERMRSCSPQSTVPQVPVRSRQSASPIEQEPKPIHLMRYVSQKFGSDWSALGTLLGLEKVDLDEAHYAAPNSLKDKCHEVLMYWVQGKGRKPVSWAVLLDALKQAEQKALADDLRKRILSGRLDEEDDDEVPRK